MGKVDFLSKKSGFMSMETETSNGFCSDKVSSSSTVQRNVDAAAPGFCGLGLQQPFHSNTTTTSTAFKSPVGMAAAATAFLRYPFTMAQWQELERQALIFKYMMASIPVPPDLLIPTTRYLSNTAATAPFSSLARGSCYNLRFSNGDPEPGRCRRTDGKKWRCSRDVAPEQKYCERHMHRSRPRSRKPVELQTEINNSNITSSIPLTKLSAKTTSHQLGSPRPYPQPSVFLSKPDLKGIPFETMATARPYKDSRCMDWMLKGQNVSIPNKDLREMMQAKGNSSTNTTFFPQHYQENNNLSSYTDFSSSFGELESQPQSDPCCLFLNPELESYSPNERQMPRQFIDAWSTARDNPTGTNKSSFDDSGKLSPSTLSLSMSGDNGVGEDTDQIQMGLGITDSEFDNSGGSKSQTLSWMTPVSWMTSAPGGPLGEVLQSRTTVSQVGSKSALRSNICINDSRNFSSGGALNLMTDDWEGSRDTSPQATALSSPSGVLHKTVTSPSDSSGGNSPTYKAAARTEIALQWMNHNK